MATQVQIANDPKRLAVVVFNLGGPDRLEAVEPFLFNLFHDPAIIGAPQPVRYLLAKLISKRRAPVAREIYAQIGGRSPLLEQTLQQADALEERLRGTSAPRIRVFVCMRYWRPSSAETAAAVKEFDPDRIVLLPLYPQFSTTTTGSSLKDWERAANREGLNVPRHAVCCYPVEPGLIEAQAGLTKAGLALAREAGQPRVLFSAHGLPKKIIARGDPYQRQVEMSVQAVVQRLTADLGPIDHAICYQSRVGPLEWIGPSTEQELARAASDRVPVVVVPIAFVSEHSETLVELDVEYREKAKDLGVPAYVRVAAVGIADELVEGLAGLVLDALSRGSTPCPRGGVRICPQACSQCICDGVP